MHNNHVSFPLISMSGEDDKSIYQMNSSSEWQGRSISKGLASSNDCDNSNLANELSAEDYFICFLKSAIMENQNLLPVQRVRLGFDEIISYIETYDDQSTSLMKLVQCIDLLEINTLAAFGEKCPARVKDGIKRDFREQMIKTACKILKSFSIDKTYTFFREVGCFNNSEKFDLFIKDLKCESLNMLLISISTDKSTSASLADARALSQLYKDHPKEMLVDLIEERSEPGLQVTVPVQLFVRKSTNPQS